MTDLCLQDMVYKLGVTPTRNAKSILLSKLTLKNYSYIKVANIEIVLMKLKSKKKLI